MITSIKKNFIRHKNFGRQEKKIKEYISVDLRTLTETIVKETCSGEKKDYIKWDFHYFHHTQNQQTVRMMDQKENQYSSQEINQVNTWENQTKTFQETHYYQVNYQENNPEQKEASKRDFYHHHNKDSIQIQTQHYFHQHSTHFQDQVKLLKSAWV